MAEGDDQIENIMDVMKEENTNTTLEIKGEKFWRVSMPAHQ
jgi:gamma-glutamylcysteine synthetase